MNCVFNIDQQSPGQGLNFKDLKASYEVVPREYENFELFVNAVSCEDNLSIECQYNSALFKRSTVENWLGSYLELLVSSADAPHAKIKTMILDGLIVPKSQVSTKIANSNIKPRDPEVERTLCRLWGKVLGLDNVTPEDNFFVLGGHSLLAVELASLLQVEFKKEISIREIFENPTILEFSAIVTDLAQATVSEIPLVPRPDISTGPVSLNQLQVWYVEELFTDTKMHNLSTSLRIKWKVDPVILERTIHYFLKRHDALRTAIEVENGIPFQRIFDHQDPIFRPELEVVQCEENIVLDLMRAETTKIFDKTTPPMFRAKLYQLGPNDYYFFFMVHHAVWDGWCFDIFFEELDVIYTALENGLEPTFKRNPDLRYLDHTIWMQKSLDAGVFDGQLDYWKNKLAAPLPILEVPTDYTRPKTASHDGGNFRFALNSQQIKRVKDFAAARNTTVFNVMLTAYKMSLSHVAGIQDIIVGSPIRGRNKPELLQTIGYFVNTLALRTSIDLNQSFDENLKRVTTTCLEGFSNQDVPFELLLRNLKYVRDMGRTAVYQTFFTFQDMTNRQFYINERPVKQVSVNNASVKTDLDIWVKVTTTSIEGAFEYRSDLFDQSTIEQLYLTFESILDQASIGDSKKNVALAPFEKKSKLTMTSLPMTLSLVPFRSSGSGSPVFFFQSVGGNVQDFVPLVKSIDPIHPVFAFQSPTSDGKKMLKNSVEEMAADYIKEINMISPNGPCILIGASMSSLIALEVAQQFKVSGRKVEKLVVLDSNGPDVEIHGHDKVCSLQKMLLYHFISFFYRFFGPNLPKKIKQLDDKMINNRALCKYNPKPYNGDLHLISSKKNNFTRHSDPLMRWRGTILGMVHSFQIEASQGSFINSAELAEVITQVL